jgi:hypothetical protein
LPRQRLTPLRPAPLSKTKPKPLRDFAAANDFAAASITSPQREQECQRPKITKNDRILSNFTKNQCQSSLEGTAENSQG